MGLCSGKKTKELIGEKQVRLEFNQINLLIIIIEAAVDVDRISREVDVDVLQDNIEQLTFCNIDNEIVIFSLFFLLNLSNIIVLGFKND